MYEYQNQKIPASASMHKNIRTENQTIEYPKELLVRDPYCVTT